MMAKTTTRNDDEKPGEPRAGTKRKAEEEAPQPDDAKKLRVVPRQPPMHLDTLLGVLNLIPRSRVTSPEEYYGQPLLDTNSTIPGLQKVCKRWDIVVEKHRFFLPRARLDTLRIRIKKDLRNPRSGAFNWPKNRYCACYAELEERALKLAGQLLFPNIGATVPVHFHVGEVKLSLRNKLELKTAQDLVHFTRHLRDCYFGAVEIDSERDDPVDLTLNPLLGKTLYSLHAENLHAAGRPFRGSTLLRDLQQLRPAFEDGFIKVRKVNCDAMLVSDIGPTMGELLHFLSHGRMGFAEIRVYMGWWFVGQSKRTIVDTIIKHFTTTAKDLHSAFPVVVFDYMSAYWPTRFARPVQIVPGRAYSFPLVNAHSRQVFHIELSQGWIGGSDVGKVRLLLRG